MPHTSAAAAVSAVRETAFSIANADSHTQEELGPELVRKSVELVAAIDAAMANPSLQSATKASEKMNSFIDATNVLETKGDEDTPENIVTKAIEGLTKTVDDRIKAIEGKSDNTKLVERLDAIETKMNRPAGKTDDKVEPSVERKSFATYLRLGNQTPVDDTKALTVGSDPGGGYLAPAEMSTEFVRDLVEFSPIRQYASVRTTTAPSVKYPARTGSDDVQWEGELEEAEESEVRFGQIEVVAHKAKTYVDISEELLADSGGAAEAEVRLALAEKFGKAEAIKFVSGTGVKQPEGFLNADIEAIINGHATNLSTDKLIDLLYDLPAPYRNAPGAAWAMNGTTLAAVRKLKDGTTGQYLWQPSFQAGQPETILGKPVVEMVDMPDIGNGNTPIVFGDWSAYRIVDRLALSVMSDPYTQATRGVVRIHGTRRVGGRVLQAARFRKLVTSAS